MTFNDHISTAEAQLIDAITQLQASNISDLVLDIRYNGGGFLDIANELSYMIAGDPAVGRAAMGSLIDSLERRGLVERQPKPGDRRVWLIATTAAGNELTEHVMKIDEVLRSELRAGISRKERRELTGLLIRLRDNVESVISGEED